MRRFVFVLLILLLAACGAPDTQSIPTITPAGEALTDDGCATTALLDYRRKYNGLMTRWIDAIVLAGQSKATDLEASIGSLEQLSGELSKLTPPECAKQAHGESLEAMQMSIGGYRDLMAKQAVGSTLRDAIDKLAAARGKVAALPGTPVPSPTVLATSTPLATWTPLPTAQPTATPAPTATPLPRNGTIASSRVQVYETPTSDTPIKTLLKGTVVQVFEVQKGRAHIRVGDLEGWVPQSSVVVQ